MSRVTMIQHINLQISDKARTRDWYEKVLGAEYLDRGPELNQGQLAVANRERGDSQHPYANSQPVGPFRTGDPRLG